MLRVSLGDQKTVEAGIDPGNSGRAYLVVGPIAVGERKIRLFTLVPHDSNFDKYFAKKDGGVQYLIYTSTYQKNNAAEPCAGVWGAHQPPAGGTAQHLCGAMPPHQDSWGQFFVQACQLGGGQTLQ
jgi:hypothetical protein